MLHVADISTLETRDDSALTFNGGAFSVAGTGKVKGVATVSTATKTTPMVFKTEGDVEMDIPNFSQGKCLKLGDGRLAFNVASDRLFMNMGWTSGRPLAYDALNGILTAGASAALDVAEGTLAFTSAAATAPSVTIYNADIVLGGETGTREAGPVALELDHVKLTATYNNNAGKVSILDRPADMPNRTSASVTLRNGAVLDVWPYGVGGNYTVRHTVDASTLQTRGSVYFSASGAGVTIAGTNFWRVTNGGKVYVDAAAGPYVYAPGVYEFDRGTLAKNAAGEPTRFQMVNPIANSCQQFFLRNRSYFAVSYFGCIGANQSTVFNYDSQRYELTFDDSEWFAGAGERTIASSNMIVTVTTTGGGLRMNPPADSVWTLYTRVDGDAGLFKGGDGTMVVDRAFRKHEYLADPCTLAYEGRTTVTGGTLKIVSGACAHHLYGLGGGATLDLDGVEVSGADIEAVGDGTIVNASIRGLTLRPTYENGAFAQVTFGSGTTLAGRVLVDFGVETGKPWAWGTVMTVARWTGAQKPDVSRWRAENVGDGCSCAFAANNDGTITATVINKRGFLLIYR